MGDLFSHDDEDVSSVRAHVSYAPVEQFRDHAKAAALATGAIGLFLLIVSTLVGSKASTSLDLVSLTFSASVILLCIAGLALFFWVAANLVYAALASIDD